MNEKKQLIECVPNFSEGRDIKVIEQIAGAIKGVAGVRLLDIDPGYDTNRTVMTFVGEPEMVVEAAFLAIRKAAELIDMRQQRGEHPRMGATDVCPLVPIANITMEEVVEWAHRLGALAGKELNLPVYMYEAAAKYPERRNLAAIRAGEYEGLAEKLKRPEWKPDYGPARFNPTAGATVVGARDFLIAYNVNLNTTSLRRANAVAFDVRERGRVKREGGTVVRNAEGQALRIPGICRGVKAIGWYLEEYGITQVSMNLVDINTTPMHRAFEACCDCAGRRGMRVTGSELVGMVPLRVMLEAGRYFLRKQRRSLGLPESEIIKIAVESLGLNALAPFDPRKKIIEYRLQGEEASFLPERSLQQFADSVASERPLPAGGAVAAYVGSLGAALATMAANVAAQDRSREKEWEALSDIAVEGRKVLEDLLRWMDKDVRAYRGLMEALRLPGTTEEERTARLVMVEKAAREASEVPLGMMETAFKAFDVLRQMASLGIPATLADIGSGAVCARAAIRCAFLNVQANVKLLGDREHAAAMLGKGNDLDARAAAAEKEILEMVKK